MINVKESKSNSTRIFFFLLPLMIKSFWGKQTLLARYLPLSRRGPSGFKSLNTLKAWLLRPISTRDVENRILMSARKLFISVKFFWLWCEVFFSLFFVSFVSSPCFVFILFFLDLFYSKALFHVFFSFSPSFNWGSKIDLRIVYTN